MGVRDIRTDRNGPVIGVISVHDDDEVLMMSARGKIQRVAVREIRSTGRNTHGVRIMSLEEGDTLAAIARVPPEELNETPAEPPLAP
jgi:DNA gyrase subunit A